MTPLEVALRSTGAAMQEWLQFGDSVNVVPSEESITDALLAVLARVPDRQCRVVRLTRKAENVVGPDFVLWIVSNRAGQLVGLPLLIQAKRLYPSGRFEALYKSGADHPQMSVLLTVADRWGVVPLYAFYQPAGANLNAGGAGVLPSACALAIDECVHTDDGSIIPPTHPGGCPYRDEGDLGVALASAGAVRNQVENTGAQPNMADLSPLAVPLACLAGCVCAPAFQVVTGHWSVPPPGPDLVELALARLRAFDDIPDLAPRDFPGWLLQVMQSNPSAAELQNITRSDVTDDVGTVVVVSDTDLGG